ncbi:MAG: glycosyltransferase family 4 protein [Anaerolineae bacterium]|nr:glycosyltransferase family 4 protein [Anaerolineae bacterium]
MVIYGSLDIISGGYLYDRLLVEHLRHQGDKVDLIALPWRTYGHHLTDNFSRNLFNQLHEAKLDVLLQDELNHPSLFWLNRQLKKNVQYPILSIVHHLRCSEARPAWQNFFYRRVEQSYLARVDGFIFNSQTTRTAVTALAGAEKESIVAYPAGDRLCPNLTLAQITARARQPGPLQILFIGNLIPRKGLHTLLAGLARLPRESWQLEVAGSLTVNPAYAHSIQRQLAAAGLTGQVTLSGPLTDTQLAERLARCQLLVVPSSYEGFGIVYLEGMGFGLPAIATTAGAASEIINHGQNGFLIPPDDPAALSRHIYELSQNRERLRQMSLAARQRYNLHPTWCQTTERIRQFLQEVTTQNDQAN